VRIEGEGGRTIEGAVCMIKAPFWLRHVAQKCKHFCDNNMQQNKDLEHVFDGIKKPTCSKADLPRYSYAEG
jgi:uncharacterized protein YhfF